MFARPFDAISTKDAVASALTRPTSRGMNSSMRARSKSRTSRDPSRDPTPTRKTPAKAKMIKAVNVITATNRLKKLTRQRINDLNNKPAESFIRPDGRTTRPDLFPLKKKPAKPKRRMTTGDIPTEVADEVEEEPGLAQDDERDKENGVEEVIEEDTESDLDKLCRKLMIAEVFDTDEAMWEKAVDQLDVPYEQLHHYKWGPYVSDRLSTTSRQLSFDQFSIVSYMSPKDLRQWAISFLSRSFRKEIGINGVPGPISKSPVKAPSSPVLLRASVDSPRSPLSPRNSPSNSPLNVARNSPVSERRSLVDCRSPPKREQHLYRDHKFETRSHSMRNLRGPASIFDQTISAQ